MKPVSNPTPTRAATQPPVATHATPNLYYRDGGAIAQPVLETDSHGLIVASHGGRGPGSHDQPDVGKPLHPYTCAELKTAAHTPEAAGSQVPKTELINGLPRLPQTSMKQNEVENQKMGKSRQNSPVRLGVKIRHKISRRPRLGS